MKGDKIMFGDYGAEGHTGLVVKVEGSMIYTVEGNVSVNGGPEGVWMKQYDLTDPSTYIPGYCRPNYDVAIVKGSTPEIPGTEPEMPVNDCTVELSVLRNGSQGAEVKTVQQLLAAKGYKPGYADGIYGPATSAAVKAFQANAGLNNDGEVGGQTWAALLKK